MNVNLPSSPIGRGWSSNSKCVEGEGQCTVRGGCPTQLGEGVESLGLGTHPPLPSRPDLGRGRGVEYLPPARQDPDRCPRCPDRTRPRLDIPQSPTGPGRDVLNLRLRGPAEIGRRT